MSLRRLEKALEVKLVRKTPKGVELTAGGMTLLTRVRRLRLARDDVTREIKDLSQGSAGHLRVGASTGTCEELVASACDALLREAPRITLLVSMVTGDAVLGSIRNGELDMVVSSSPPLFDDLAQEPLYDDVYTVCCSVHHHLAKRKRLEPRDLVGESWAAAANLHDYQRRSLQDAFTRNGLPPPHIAVASSSSTVRFRAMTSGSLLDYTTMRHVLQVGPRYEVVPIRVREMSLPRRVAITHRRDAYLPPVARRLIEILKKSVRESAA
jgi:DNA-binding transcriptional LysR family regulator